MARTTHSGPVFYAKPDASTFKELEVASCAKTLDVATDPSGPIVLCETTSGLRVVRVGGEESNRVIVVPILASKFGASMEASRDGIAIATSDSIAIYSEPGGWRTVAFRVRTESADALPPDHLLLSEGVLWLGVDHGEFGGGLYRLLVPGEGNLLPPEHLRQMNVLGVREGRGDEIWVASGLSHLGVRRASLFRIQRGQIRPDVVIRWNRNKEVDASRKEAAFSAFTVSPDGVPIVVDSATGIYSIRGDSPVALVEGSIGISHQTTMRTGKGSTVPVTEQYEPTDVVAWPDGRLFVSTNGLGVLEFSRSLFEVSVRQLLVE